MATAMIEKERLISADSPIFPTGDWIKERLRRDLHSVWDEAQEKAGGWPHSQQQVRDQLRAAGVSEANCKKVLCDNALKAFALA